MESRPTTGTPSSLLDGLRQAEATSWRRLALLYGPLVYGWCRKVGLQPADAEDVLQEVFVVVAARVRDFHRDRPGDSFRAWLRRITRHKIGDWLRRQRAGARAAGGSAAAEQLAALPDEEISEEVPHDSHAAALCRRALDLIRPEFQERTWQAFWRTAAEGQEPAAVAADLDMSRNAVYIARARVLARLREVLGDT